MGVDLAGSWHKNGDKSGSSAYEHGTQFSALAPRLRTRHGIELLFVDAPLLDAATTMKGRGGDDNYDNDNDEEGNVIINDESSIATHHRRWYVKEEDRISTLVVLWAC
jgi:hypothetical protein